MSDRLRILLSGPGLIGKKHAELVVAQPACELAAVMAPDHAHNEEFASAMGVPCYHDFAEAVASTRPDAVIISSPNVAHREQASIAIHAGLPTLIEKPITDSLASAKEVLDLSVARGVPVLVGHHRTYSTLLDTALTFLRSEKFGRPVALIGSAVFFKPAHYFVDGPWRTRLGGGPILINLIHEIGLMRTFFGEIATVSAIASSAQRKFEVEDSVAISLSFCNGAIGTFLLSDTGASDRSWELTSGENPAYPYYPDSDCYHFAGTNGSLDFPSMRARHYSQDASWWKPFERETLALKHADPLERQMSHFVDVIQGKATPRVSARDGYLNLLVIDALNRSIVERRPIDIPPTSDTQSVVR